MSFNTFYKSLTRKKPLVVSGETKLNKFLTTMDLTAMGVGTTLGVGVYVLTGEVSKLVAGPAVLISFAIAAFASLLAGFCFAEFGARVPKAGSAYIYTFVTIGEFVAFIIGWNLILEYAIGSASIAKSITGYIDDLAAKKISEFWTEILPLNVPYLGTYVDLFAFAIVMIVSTGQAFGARESTVVNNTFAALKITIILYVIICGCFKIDINNWKVPAEEVSKGYGKGGFFPYGFVGVVEGAALCFFGFIGFDVIAAASEEIKNPKKSVPQSIGLSLLIVFLAYVGVSSVLTLMVPYFELDKNAPLTHVFESFGWTVAVYVVSFGSIAGLFSCLMGAMFPLPRVLLAMSSDGLLFSVFSNVHPRFKTPTYGILISGLLTGTLSAIFDVNQLVNMISIGTLTAYTIVAICVLLLKYDIVESDHNCEDDREQLIAKLFNTEGFTRPTKFTSKLSTITISIYAVLCVFLCVVIKQMGEEIVNGNAIAIVLFSLSIIAITIAMLILSRQPKSPKSLTFNVPFTPWFPALSIVLNIYLLSQLNMIAWIRFIVWIALGLIIYVFYSRRFSKMKEPALVEGSFNDLFEAN